MVGRKVTDGPVVEDGSVGDSVDQMNSARETASLAEHSRVTDSNTDLGNEQPNWEQWAQDAFADSTDFMDSSLRVQWERSDRTFQNRPRS